MALLKILGTVLLLAGLTQVAFAGVSVVPEIDGATVVSAFALVTGTALILKVRKK